MVWVKFHDKLCKGAKRGLPRAVRFVFMELCLESRPGRGVLDLPVGMSDLDALHDVLGGNRKELAESLKVLAMVPKPTVDDPEPRAMVELTGEAGARRLTIPSWDAWNSGHEAPGASTERSRRYRQRTSPTDGEQPQRGDVGDARNEPNGDATTMQRSLHALPTLVQREGNEPATQYRGEERREEENRDPPNPPLAGGSGVAVPFQPSEPAAGGHPLLTGKGPVLCFALESPAPAPKVRKRTGATSATDAYPGAYQTGHADAGGTVSRPTGADAKTLGRAAATHARGPDGEPLKGDAVLAWIRERAADFRRAVQDPEHHRGGYSPFGFLAWLDNGARHQRGGRPQDIQQRGAVPGSLGY